MSTPTRKDWILWGALGCALVATYHAEYTLAVAAGFHPYVALAVPGALDLYVIRALQQRRDVLVAVLAMVAANVASHLIAKEVLQVGWQVIAAVGAIAPLILWRVYSLKHTRVDASVPGVEAGAVDAPEYPTAPDRIPDWMDQEYPVSEPHPCTLSEPFLRSLDDECSECGAPWGTHAGVLRKRAEHAAKYPDHQTSAEYRMASAPELPQLPPEYPTLTEEQWDELTASDREYLSELNEYIHSTDSHTLAGLREALGIGQARATRLIKYARKEGTW